jgi:L-gulonate 3-dehydrogenase
MAGEPWRTAVVGAGLVGQGWAIVFARAGLPVTIYDERLEIRRTVMASLEAKLADLHRYGLIDSVEAVAARFKISDNLEDALRDVRYVQESVFERVDVKTQIAHAISNVLSDDAIVGSSSSGIPASAFTEGVARRDQFLIAHPVNPPHLVPVVELVAAPWTRRGVVEQVRCFMEELGQKPIVVKREIEGFVLNRLQGALLNEAWALFEEGIASAADIDRTVSDGLGVRWSFMGPFETIDLNAPGGVVDYADRLGGLFHSIALSRDHPKRWSKDTAIRVGSERRETLPLSDLDKRCAWRDRQLMALAARRMPGERD